MQDVSNATTPVTETPKLDQSDSDGASLLVRTLWLVGSYLVVMGIIVVAQS